MCDYFQNKCKMIARTTEAEISLKYIMLLEMRIS